MSAYLQHFHAAQLRLTRAQAAQILEFFFPDQPVSPDSLTDDDIGFAQALLVEAIDASDEMSYVQILFEKTYMKAPSASIIKSLAKSFLKQAAKQWFRHATGKDWDDPKIYESVRRTISRNFKSIWGLRLQTGELTY